MITRHHIILALFISLMACSSFLFSAPLIAVLVCTGTGIGAILPDIHMSRPKHFKTRTLAWSIARLPRNLCLPVLCGIYAILGHPVKDHADKRLTHSLPGILFIETSAILLFSPLLLFASPATAGTAVLFLAGILLGMALHLAEDLCTRKGIYPLFPFSEKRIAGSIRPCDCDDPRIPWYQIQHGLVFLLIIGLDSAGIVPAAFALPVGCAGAAACTGIMIGSSEVAFRRDPGTSGRDVQPFSQSSSRL